MSRAVRILLAEDNAADVWLIQEALKRQSLECEVETYATADEAVLAVTRCGMGDHPVPDVILVDYNLPKGQGGDILQAASSNPQLADVPKAILSSFLQPEEQERMMHLGASCFITKPGNLHEFLNVVGSKVSSLLNRPMPM